VKNLLSNRRVLFGVAATAAVCALLVLVAGHRAPKGVCISFETPFARGSGGFRRLEEIVGVFREKNPEIHVKLLPGGPRERDAIIKHILAGRAGDVIEIPLAALPGLAKKGYVIDVANALTDDIGDVFPLALAAAEYDNATYAMPFRARATQLIYNGGILLESGFLPDDPLLNNWTELLETCQTIARRIRGRGCRPLGIAGADADMLAGLGAALIGQTDGELLALRQEKDLSDLGAIWRVTINNEAGIHALSMLRRLGEYVPRGALYWSRDDLLREFTAGRVAMFFGDTAAVSRIRREAPDVQVKVVEAPVDRTYASCVVYYGAAITSAARHPEACRKLLTHLCGGASQNVIMTGGRTGLPTSAPVCREFLDDPWYGEHPCYKPFLKALRYSSGHARVQGWREVQKQAFAPELKKVIAGKTDPRAAAKRIEERGNAALGTYYGYIGHASETAVLGMSIIAGGVFLLVFFTVGHRPKR